MTTFDELTQILEQIAKVNKDITKPFIEKKTGLQIVDRGQDHGMIVTEVDLDISKALLGGGLGYRGFRERYPGSFSEESDSPDRLEAKTILELDPVDGTGDFVDTYQMQRVMPPTTLVSKLTRENTSERFTSVGGIIFDIANEIALVSDRENVVLYKISGGMPREIKYERTQPEEWNETAKIRINRRSSYPQLAFDGPFMKYLRAEGLDIEQVQVGGAGIFAMQIFRNYIKPLEEIRGFSDLTPLTIGFNAQPDWKTWDTDPTEVIASALRMPTRTDIYGTPLKANAANSSLKDMHHTKGYVLSTDERLRIELCKLALRFEERNQDCRLLDKDYGYKDAILRR